MKQGSIKLSATSKYLSQDHFISIKQCWYQNWCVTLQSSVIRMNSIKFQASLLGFSTGRYALSTFADRGNILETQGVETFTSCHTWTLTLFSCQSFCKEGTTVSSFVWELIVLWMIVQLKALKNSIWSWIPSSSKKIATVLNGQYMDPVSFSYTLFYISINQVNFYCYADSVCNIHGQIIKLISMLKLTGLFSHQSSPNSPEIKILT